MTTGNDPRVDLPQSSLRQSPEQGRQLTRLPGTERTRRLRPKLRWELIGCGLHGHELVGMDAAQVRPQDHLVVREADGLRWYRCLRCDSWLPLSPPASPPKVFPPERDEIKLPLRGRPLRNRYVLRLISLDRIVHFLVLGALGATIFWFTGHRTHLRGVYLHFLNSLQASFGFASAHNSLLREITHVVSFSSTKLYLYAIAISAYAAVNAVEACGLWLERRWAEYLTFIEVTLLLPYELYELAVSISAWKIAALCINLIVMLYLFWVHRLFGFRGGAAADRIQQIHDTGWQALERATPMGEHLPAMPDRASTPTVAPGTGDLGRA